MVTWTRFISFVEALSSISRFSRLWLNPASIMVEQPLPKTRLTGVLPFQNYTCSYHASWYRHKQDVPCEDLNHGSIFGNGRSYLKIWSYASLSKEMKDCIVRVRVAALDWSSSAFARSNKYTQISVKSNRTWLSRNQRNSINHPCRCDARKKRSMLCNHQQLKALQQVEAN